ncbi:hypothetical protein C7964_10829 [Loktanella sp. PT4BL]|jgi:hypothetical protein|nr:acyltransferase [Loktanella sp. 1ANDIMAR09]KQI70911.1 acyltransferase [Loktanella sp. 5RATIMAR09]PXW67199.1 hypothetical protein C7964_10829 [Loktanella sp. PT4BL]
MIIAIAGIGGAIWGVLLAKKRGGNRLDMVQHAASCAIASGLLGLFASIALARIFG